MAPHVRSCSADIVAGVALVGGLRLLAVAAVLVASLTGLVVRAGVLVGHLTHSSAGRVPVPCR